MELIASVDDDPWGLAYRIVLNRLRPAEPTFSETISRENLDHLVDALFLWGVTHDPVSLWRVWLGVTG